MVCQVIIAEEEKAFFAQHLLMLFTAVYNCIFPECYLCTVSILELDWSIFLFQLLITTKLLSMDCPLWKGNHREGNTIELAFYFDYTVSENQRALCHRRMKCVLQLHYLKFKNISFKAD